MHPRPVRRRRVVAGAVALLSEPKPAREAVSEEESAETAPRRAEPSQLPATAEPHDVVSALLQSAGANAGAVAAHLWLSDPATATYRLVAGAGEKLPSAVPLPLDDPGVASVAARGEASLEPVLSLKDAESATTLWRFAFPVVGGPASGLGVLDIESVAAPAPPAHVVPPIARVEPPPVEPALGLEGRLLECAPEPNTSERLLGLVIRGSSGAEPASPTVMSAAIRP